MNRTTFSVVVLLSIAIPVLLDIFYRPTEIKSYMPLLFGTSQASSNAVEIPADWPLPDILPPSGATKDVVPSAWRQSRDNSTCSQSGIDNAKMKYWRIGFDSQLTWNELVQHYDKLLTARGYAVDAFQSYGLQTCDGVTMNAIQNYDSDDKQIKVTISFSKGCTDFFHEAYEAYCVEVDIYH